MFGTTDKHLSSNFRISQNDINALFLIKDIDVKEIKLEELKPQEFIKEKISEISSTVGDNAALNTPSKLFEETQIKSNIYLHALRMKDI